MISGVSDRTSDRLRVLIVDDQPAVARALSVLLDLHDIPNVVATTPDEATAIARGEVLGAVLQDMNFVPSETSGRAGVELFRRLRERDPGLPIFLLTAWASLETAVELVREGAVDYVQKPWDDAKLVATLQALLRSRAVAVGEDRQRGELATVRATLAREHDLRGLVYASRAMHRAVALAIQVAPSDAPVMLTGPSGAGKERVAEIVQANSRRKHAPFVRVNVGAIPAELMEAELFGAEAGAYTGLKGRRIGHFEAADGGTLFLDEIDSLPLAGQVKLLRVLQGGELLRLGSSKAQKVDVRVLSATNAYAHQGDRRRPLPRGPLLPPRRGGDPRAAARRASRGRAAAGASLPHHLRRRTRRAAAAVGRRGVGAPCPRLAGQRARAARIACAAPRCSRPASSCRPPTWASTARRRPKRRSRCRRKPKRSASSSCA